MTKKYLIAVAVAIFLFAGFMLYRSHQKKIEGQAYKEKQTRHMIDIAQTSPRAGLGKVGRALKRYYEDHNAYPTRLTDLYPDYIGNKPFLTEVEWHYEPKGLNFYLSKTTHINGKTRVASVDNRLRPETEKEIMVARPTPVFRTKPLKRPKSSPEKQTKEKLSKLALARKEFFEALSQGQIGVASVYSPQDDEVRLISTLIPEVLSSSTSEADVDIESELSRNYLVWKGEGGVLGFGNIQYPDTDRLSIFAIGQWYNLQMPIQKREKPTVGYKQATKKPPELLASTLYKNFLIWKDQTGSVGFGNTAYPTKNLETVYDGDSWQGMPKTADSGFNTTETGRKKKPVSPVLPASKDHLISILGNQYLVWKDKNGTVGFGNVQYPHRDLEVVLQQGDWLVAESMLKTSEGAGTGDPSQATVEEPKKDMASRFAKQFLIWKDNSGRIGFGNTQYPRKDVSAIYGPDRWESEARQLSKKKTKVRESTPTRDTGPGMQIASKFSGGYLVWKGKQGTLGFGNLQYPGHADVSSICVDGDWHPVSN